MSGVAVDFQPTRCAVCGTEGNAAELYPAKFDLAAFNPVVFSARRLPDGLHFRIVRCSACGLLRSDPIVDPALLERLYAESTFDDTEAANVRRTYGRYLAELERYRARKGSLLEVGCGSGFFLEEAVAHGYARVVGVEPSVRAAAEGARGPGIEIVCDVMRPGLFPAGTFDVVCMFQTLDHLVDPGAVLEECFQALRPGGLILAINHDSEAWSARLLGERSPIIDIEHAYLYGPDTMARLFERHGFRVCRVGPVINCYSLRYLAGLLPLPLELRWLLLRWLSGSRLGERRVWVPLGNLRLIAQRPGG